MPIKTDTTEIQKIREQYEKLYANKLNNLEEMDKFLDTDNLPRLYQEETHNLNRLITSSQIEFLINKTPRKQKSNTRWLLWGILPNYKKEIILLKLFQKIEEEKTPLNPFYKATTTLISTSDKDSTKKENYRPISLMNIYAKVNKILVT